MPGRNRGAFLLGLVLSLASGACAGVGSRPVAGPTPSVSPSPAGGKEKLCQPFPDRLIDGFQAAYRNQDVEALRDLVRVDGIHDTGAVAFAGRADFKDVETWARAGWEADDRLELTGYGAFAGTHDGFTMYLVRENEGFREAGIAEASFLLHGRSTGCVIDELGSVGPVQVRGAPCRFYEEFGDHPAVAAEEPSGCADGSGEFARLNHAAAWTGEEMIVAGGSRGGDFYQPDLWESGLLYEPGSGWTATSEAPGPSGGFGRAVWTGEEALLWGGWSEGPDAVAYDPAADRWRALPDWPLQDPEDPPGVWTGSELILWGSSSHTDDPQRVGAIYDPATDSWRTTSPAPIAGRNGHGAVWTGEEMLVWGGSNYKTDLGDGAAYDPATDTWRRIHQTTLSPRMNHIAVWTGEEMVVWGGTSYSSSRGDGAAYDPRQDTWRRLAPSPIGERHWHTAVWTGQEMIVWGGHSYRTEHPWADGAAYDPRDDRWTILPDAPIEARCHHSAVWTGQELIVYGGYDGCGSGGRLPFGDGAAYDPLADTWIRLNPAA
jgi:N-acetylneuraminic acid mutarotase